MGTAARNPRRWPAVAAALAVLGAVALLPWWRSTPDAPAPQEASVPPARAPEPVRPRPTAPAPAPALGALASSGPAEPPSPPPELPPGTTPMKPEDAPPVDLPPGTQRLEEEFFPGTTDWESIPIDESHQAQLRILPLRYNVVAPMPIAVQLEMKDAQGQRQPLPSPRVRVRSLEHEGRPWIDVPVKDDGSGADERAGDLLYTATLQPTAEQKKQLLGRVLVEGSVDVPGVGLRTLPSVFIYTVGPRAKLTGRWFDSKRNGNLLLEAELDVQEAGLFTLMAQVFGPNLEPLAWVRQTERLGAGRRTLALEVFGKVLREAGVDGPYRVRQVLLSRDHENSADYDPGVTIEEAHRTRAYRATEFSPAPWAPPPRVLAEEVDADHPSQRDKPPPERERDIVSPGEPQPTPPATSADGPPAPGPPPQP